MDKPFLKAALGWGIGLWLIGYALGILLFPIIPANLIGWVIMPIGIFVTLWVLFKKISAKGLGFYFSLGLAWAVIAIIFDYLFLVKVFNPLDGYYKLDVYIYYFLTLTLPVLAGWWKRPSKIPAKLP